MYLNYTLILIIVTKKANDYSKSSKQITSDMVSGSKKGMIKIQQEFSSLTGESIKDKVKCIIKLSDNFLDLFCDNFIMICLVKSWTKVCNQILYEIGR